MLQIAYKVIFRFEVPGVNFRHKREGIKILDERPRWSAEYVTVGTIRYPVYLFERSAAGDFRYGIVKFANGDKINGFSFR